MKANELRIGNFYQENGEIYRVSIDDLINLIRHDGTEYKSDMNPIPLTEEWLKKFEFEKDEETKTWSLLTNLDKFDYCFEINNKYQKHFQPDFLSIDIKYVHQLQNLYFTLTGEELKLNTRKQKRV